MDELIQDLLARIQKLENKVEKYEKSILNTVRLLNIGAATGATTGNVFADGYYRTRKPGDTRYRGDFQALTNEVDVTAYDDTGGVYIPLKINALQMAINSYHTRNSLIKSPTDTTKVNVFTIGMGTYSGLFIRVGAGGIQQLVNGFAVYAEWLVYTDSTNAYVTAVRSGSSGATNMHNNIFCEVSARYVYLRVNSQNASGASWGMDVEISGTGVESLVWS